MVSLFKEKRAYSDESEADAVAGADVRPSPAAQPDATVGPDSKASKWWPWVRRAFALLMIVVALYAWMTGLAATILLFGPAVVVVATVLQRVVARFQGRLVTTFVADPFNETHRSYLAQFTLRASLTALVIAGAVYMIPRYVITDNEYRAWFWLIAGPALIFAVLQLLPTRPVSRSLNAVVAVLVAFLGFQLVSIHLRSGLDDAVRVTAPVEGEWVVGAGGRSTLVSHHYSVMFPQQRDAIDMMVASDGRTYEGDKSDPASYYAWDQPLLAPADGTVVEMEIGLPDWPVGQKETELEKAPGNYVIIDIGDGHYAFLAHMKMGSATVQVGDRVAAGQEIGLVGNSGNTSEPHLHFHIQDSPTVDVEVFGDGVSTFPVEFTNVTHIRGGTEHADQQDQLRRNDIIRSEG